MIVCRLCRWRSSPGIRSVCTLRGAAREAFVKKYWRLAAARSRSLRAPFDGRAGDQRPVRPRTPGQACGVRGFIGRLVVGRWRRS